MRESWEDIMQENKQCIRFSKLASGGPLYTKMVRNTTKPAMHAKELGNLPEDIICL
jgi:hypothetical protein